MAYCSVVICFDYDDTLDQIFVVVITCFVVSIRSVVTNMPSFVVYVVDLFNTHCYYYYQQYVISATHYY